MTDHLLKMLEFDPSKQSNYVGSFEFGTYGDSFLEVTHSLRTTVLENCLRRYGGGDKAREWMENEYKELYLPAESRCGNKAQEDAFLYLERILGVEGFI